MQSPGGGAQAGGLFTQFLLRRVSRCTRSSSRAAAWIRVRGHAAVACARDGVHTSSVCMHKSVVHLHAGAGAPAENYADFMGLARRMDIVWCYCWWSKGCQAHMHPPIKSLGTAQRFA